MVNEFKVGDQVAHCVFGNGVVTKTAESWDIACQVKVQFESREDRCFWCVPENLRPRNFLSKIAEEQEKEFNTVDRIYHNAIDKLNERFKTVDQQFNKVFNTDRFQRNAYGQLVDTVTGLSAESDGLVDISSIKDTIREIG